MLPRDSSPLASWSFRTAKIVGRPPNASIKWLRIVRYTTGSTNVRAAPARHTATRGGAKSAQTKLAVEDEALHAPGSRSRAASRLPSSRTGAGLPSCSHGCSHRPHDALQASPARNPLASASHSQRRGGSSATQEQLRPAALRQDVESTQGALKAERIAVYRKVLTASQFRSIITPRASFSRPVDLPSCASCRHAAAASVCRPSKR